MILYSKDMEASQELYEALQKNEFFEGFSKEEISLLVSFMERVSFRKGEWVVREGEENRSLYIIERGRVEVLKKRSVAPQWHQIAVLRPGEWVGEMAFFEGTQRSASVRALTDTIVIFLSVDDLYAAHREDARGKLAFGLAKQISQRLRMTNESFVKLLERKVKLFRIHNEVGQLLVSLFILLSLYFYVVKALATYASKVAAYLLTPFIIFLFTIFAFFMLTHTHRPLPFYGVTLKNWKRDLLEGTLYTLPILAGITFIKWVVVTTIPIFQSIPVFDITPDTQTFSITGQMITARTGMENLIFGALYALLVPVQEFLARGCLQSSFQNFFRGPHRIFLAILTSNLIFCLVHIVHTFSFLFAVFFLGIFWGWLYARQRSLVGVSISHLMIAAWTFFFLNFQRVLIY